MFYVGLDIHTKHITICVLNSDGKVHQRCQRQRAETMLLVLRELPESFAVCDEASTGYGRFFELLQPLATRVIVAHPGLLRLIFRSKRWWPSGAIRIASLREQQAGRFVLRLGALSGSIGLDEPPGPHHSRRLADGAAAADQSRVAGDSTLTDRARRSSPHSTRRPRPQEDRDRGHGS